MTEILLEPDTGFTIKEIKDEGEYKRVVVEVQKFEKLPIEDKIKLFNIKKEKHEPKPQPKPQLQSQPQTTHVTQATEQMKAYMFKQILCQGLMNEAEFNTVSPFDVRKVGTVLATKSTSALSFRLPNICKNFAWALKTFSDQVRSAPDVNAFASEYVELIKCIKAEILKRNAVDVQAIFPMSFIDKAHTTTYAEYTSKKLDEMARQSTKADWRGMSHKMLGFIINGYGQQEMLAKLLNGQYIDKVKISAAPFSPAYVLLHGVNQSVNENAILSEFSNVFEILPYTLIANPSRDAQGCNDVIVGVSSSSDYSKFVARGMNLVSGGMTYKLTRCPIVKARSSDVSILTKLINTGLCVVDITVDATAVSLTVPDRASADFLVNILSPVQCDIIDESTQPTGTPQVQGGMAMGMAMTMNQGTNTQMRGNPQQSFSMMPGMGMNQGMYQTGSMAPNRNIGGGGMPPQQSFSTMPGMGTNMNAQGGRGNMASMSMMPQGMNMQQQQNRMGINFGTK